MLLCVRAQGGMVRRAREACDFLQRFFIGKRLVDRPQANAECQQIGDSLVELHAERVIEEGAQSWPLLLRSERRQAWVFAFIWSSSFTVHEQPLRSPSENVEEERDELRDFRARIVAMRSSGVLGQSQESITEFLVRFGAERIMVLICWRRHPEIHEHRIIDLGAAQNHVVGLQIAVLVPDLMKLFESVREALADDAR